MYPHNSCILKAFWILPLNLSTKRLPVLFQDIQGTLDVGREKLDDTLSRGELVKQETSKQGQDLIKEELTMLTNDFEQFDTDINDLQNNLGKCNTWEWSMLKCILLSADLSESSVRHAKMLIFKKSNENYSLLSCYVLIID